MKRREMLLTSGAALLGLSAFPLGWTAAADDKKKKVLYFTRSAGFEHSVVKLGKDGQSFSDKELTALGKQAGFEVTCTKDPAAFDGNLDQYDVLAFYATGVCLAPAQKQKVLDAVSAGKGFVGIHAATDAFATKDGIDPFITMIGGQFNTHGAQQKATMLVVSPKFPGVAKLGKSFEMLEEWYAFKNLNPDMHVILVQETKGMKGPQYARPPFPATWARMHGKGRVFYTSLGHREDVVTSKIFRDVLLGGLAWTLGNVEADVTANFKEFTPDGNKLEN